MLMKYIFEQWQNNTVKYGAALVRRQKAEGKGNAYSELTIIIFIHFSVISTTTITVVYIVYISPNCAALRLSDYYSNLILIFGRALEAPTLSTSFPPQMITVC